MLDVVKGLWEAFGIFLVPIGLIALVILLAVLEAIWKGVRAIDTWLENTFSASTWRRVFIVMAIAAVVALVLSFF